MDKEKFRDLIKNLEENREQIIEEKIKSEENRKRKQDEFLEHLEKIKNTPFERPKEWETIEKYDIQENEAGEIFLISGKDIFLFDKEGYEFFQKGFRIDSVYNEEMKELLKVRSEDGIHKYLGKLKEGYRTPSYFHREFMRKEILNFSLGRNIDKSEIVVHHRNFNPQDNKKENLLVMTKQEHDELHNRS